ncbi:MAG: virulence RhuM family protein [Bacteroidetes bacterium]|nr:virulence RhuM family protein [Bacteroidota bacterium]MCL2302404.1 virulence RhuM family protein [Lentimicrobiaceae bacterium]
MKTIQNEIILYQPDSNIQLEVRIENETVWLTQAQMVDLFQRDVSVISRHINNIFREGELDKKSNLHFLQIAFSDKPVIIYSLDVIISVGYRVKSQRGTQFRIWANRILKDYLLKGYAVNQRIERLEHKIVEHDQKFDLLIKTALPPKEGIFFDGQIFDAYVFASNLIKSATKSIILIDNYIDETVLLLLSKRLSNVSSEIYTKQISAQLQLDLNKHNAQYKPVNIYKSNNFHDRFLIIDNVIYHIGASLKDLGKKLFAFSKMELEARLLLQNI